MQDSPCALVDSFYVGCVYAHTELKPFMEILSQFKRAEAFASDLEYYLG